jgi:thiol-disulfide isomerase/thioredoxin
VALAALALVTGCTAGDPGAPGIAKIDVDTRSLRQMKQEAGVDPCVPGDADPVEGGLPDITLPCLGGGRAVNLSTLKGPLIINFWQSTCGPCRTEMPLVQDFYEHHGDEVAVMGIDWQDVQAEAALQLVQQTGVTYPLLADPQSDTDGAAPFPRLAGMPYWAFVDADGRVVGRGQFIAFHSEQDLIDAVREKLGVRL